MGVRAGDTVKHVPSEETWIVAGVAEGVLYPAGWPPTKANLSDCVLIESCSDADHDRMIIACRRLPPSDPRHTTPPPQTTSPTIPVVKGDEPDDDQ